MRQAKVVLPLSSRSASSAASSALSSPLHHHSKSTKKFVARAAAPRPSSSSSSGGDKASSSSSSARVEVLKKEKELLQETLAAAAQATDQLAGALQNAGKPVAAAEAKAKEAAAGGASGSKASSSSSSSSSSTATATAAVDLASDPLALWAPVAAPADPLPFADPKQPIPALPESSDGTECLKWDDSLWSHADHFRYRWNVFKGIRQAIDANEGGLDAFSRGYEKYGFNRGLGGENGQQPGIWYREWAPGARAVALVGEFNGWEPGPNHWATKDEFGVWSLFLPDADDGTSAIKHRTKVKARVETAYGEWVERIPAWIKWATQEWNEVQFNGVYYEPPRKAAPGQIPSSPDEAYQFAYPRPERPRALRIYECHVGMSSAEPKVNSYLEFARDVLPRVRAAGYNAIQIMAIQEHAYYGSFGYHVTNFFAASSRCGSPDELKAMIDEAHRLGLVVLMDIVHSHASKNTHDGINMWDGTDGGYFHGGGRGYHWMWDSRCFNYGNWETLRFLVSNARWWMDEFKFDGYRFDGVTSMMYHHHGLQMAFTGNYDEYFGLATDVEAVAYLMLVNSLLHGLWPDNAITIGEDVSGMPTFCRPVSEGGVGFDYRLQMAIADKWIEVLKLPDEAWDMGNIVHTLTNRRYAEACVGYAESHDQALVGDKTIAFWLMDAAMYDGMALEGPGKKDSPAVDRGIALHKMIRLITMALGGESYLNFMGNEFGHPEWIDFPRDDSYDPSTGALVPGNGGSLDKCRRRWDLRDAVYLKYKFMAEFDAAIMHLDKAFGFVASSHEWVSRKNEGDKVVVVERGDLVFVFNFHPSSSFSDYRVGCPDARPRKIVLSSDEGVFGGWNNVSKDADVEFVATEGDHDNRPASMLVYSPARTVVAYAPAEFVDAKADEKPGGIAGLGVKGVGPYFAV